MTSVGGFVTYEPELGVNDERTVGQTDTELDNRAAPSQLKIFFMIKRESERVKRMREKERGIKE